MGALGFLKAQRLRSRSILNPEVSNSASLSGPSRFELVSFQQTKCSHSATPELLQLLNSAVTPPLPSWRFLCTRDKVISPH